MSINSQAEDSLQKAYYHRQASYAANRLLIEACIGSSPGCRAN